MKSSEGSPEEHLDFDQRDDKPSVEPKPEAGEPSASEAEAPQTPQDPLAGLAQDETPPPTAEAFAQMKDRMMRALAEAENVRRRSAREVSEAKIFGITQFARDILAVQDNLVRALDTIDPAAIASQEASIKAFVEGVELTNKDLTHKLENHGVRLVPTDGEKFDPNRHQAMFEIEDASVAPGTVVQTLQTGYLLGERTLRPAMVGVAKALKPQAEAGELPLEGEG